MTSIYQAMRDAGVTIDSHESDLYVPNVPKAREILKQFPQHYRQAKTFVDVHCPTTTWIEIPFAYDPFWQSK